MTAVGTKLQILHRFRIQVENLEASDFLKGVHKNVKIEKTGEMTGRDTKHATPLPETTRQ